MNDRVRQGLALLVTIALVTAAVGPAAQFGVSPVGVASSHVIHSGTVKEDFEGDLLGTWEFFGTPTVQEDSTAPNGSYSGRFSTGGQYRIDEISLSNDGTLSYWVKVSSFPDPGNVTNFQYQEEDSNSYHAQIEITLFRRRLLIQLPSVGPAQKPPV